MPRLVAARRTSGFTLLEVLVVVVIIGILTSMARANALLIMPADRDEVTPGEELRALMLDDPVHVAEPPFE